MIIILSNPLMRSITSSKPKIKRIINPQKKNGLSSRLFKKKKRPKMPVTKTPNEEYRGTKR